MTNLYKPIPFFSNYAISDNGIVYRISDSEAAAAYGMKKNVPYWRANKNRMEPWNDGLICHYLFNY